MTENENKACLHALQYHNGQIQYTTNLITRAKDKKEEDEWPFIFYAIQLQLHRDAVEKIEKWITEQKLDY